MARAYPHEKIYKLLLWVTAFVGISPYFLGVGISGIPGFFYVFSLFPIVFLAYNSFSDRFTNNPKLRRNISRIALALFIANAATRFLIPFDADPTYLNEITWPILRSISSLSWILSTVALIISLTTPVSSKETANG